MAGRNPRWLRQPAVPRTAVETAGRLHPTPDEWVLWFGWPTNPLPMNGSRGNHYGHAAKVRDVLVHALALITAARIPALPRVEAQLTWWVDTARRRDEDNLAGLEKPLFDAIVRAGVVADDTPQLMTKPRGRILRVDDSAGLVSQPGFTLRISALTPEAAE